VTPCGAAARSTACIPATDCARNIMQPSELRGSMSAHGLRRAFEQRERYTRCASKCQPTTAAFPRFRDPIASDPMSTMRIVLFRHGPAGERDAAQWPDDQLRPLTERGQSRTRLAARGLARLNGRARAIWTSPFMRAAQTAEIVRDAFKLDDIHVAEALKPGGSWRELIEQLQRSRVAAGTIVLVGHEPDLGKFAGSLVFGAPRALPLKKAGACAIDFEGPIEAGGGRLAWLLPPKLLRSLSRKKPKTRNEKVT